MAKAKFRTGLSDFVKEHYKVSGIDKLTDQQRSDGLGKFYISEIFSKLNPGVFPEDIDELDDYIVDGPDDQSIDILYSHDTHHYLIQVKYRGRSNKTEEDGDVSYFLDSAVRLHPIAGKDYKKNTKLQDRLSYIDWKEDTFQFIYLTTGKGSADITNLENTGIPDSNRHNDLKDLSSRATFSFHDEQKLNEEYRDSLKSGNSVKAEIMLSKDCHGIAWYKHHNSDGKISYISTLSAAQIYAIHEKHKTALFNLNIRNWIGDTSTNKNIEKTAIEEADDFFFFNNGISAIASKIEEDVKTNMLLCTDFSIINGAQTVRSIYKKYRELNGLSNEKIKNLRVMIRITLAENLHKQNDFVDKVTQFNNTQNAIKISDFRSNDGVQTSLSKYFEKISYKGKKYHYKNKRQRDTPRNSININLDDFCKAIFTFWYGAVDMHGGIKHLYDTGVNGGYTRLFGDDNGDIPPILYDKELKTFSSVYFICESVRSFQSEIIKKKKLKHEHSEQQALLWQRALQGKYLICFVIGQLLLAMAREKYGELNSVTDDREALTIALSKNKYYQPSFWRDKSEVIKPLETIVEIACEILYDVYATAYNSPNFVHRNFVRSTQMHDSIKQKVESRMSQVRSEQNAMI